MSSPFEYLSFSLPCTQIIVTNDGTKGDQVFKRIGYKKATLHFLYNSIEKKMEARMKPPPFELPKEYISYIARIASWKRQHLVIEAMDILKRKGIYIPLYIVGSSKDDPGYYAKLLELVKVKKLEEQVYFTGELQIEVTWYILKNSCLTLSLYEYSNLGNVALEALAMGVPLDTIDVDNSLKDIPRDAYYPLKSDTPMEIAEAIEKLLKFPEIRKQISQNAKEFAENFFLDWDERSKLEVGIILSSLRA